MFSEAEPVERSEPVEVVGDTEVAEGNFDSLTPRVQAAVLALDALVSRGVPIVGVSKAMLAKMVTAEAKTPIAKRTLLKAETYRRNRRS
jgi:hypothetical protein